MELKKYQKKVVADMSRYLDLMRETGSYAAPGWVCPLVLLSI